MGLSYVGADGKGSSSTYPIDRLKLWRRRSKEALDSTIIATGPGLRVSEEMTAKSIKDEIIWSFYASSDRQLGYFIIVP
jgi:hypothetical protein